jgi:hypothetical protein
MQDRRPTMKCSFRFNGEVARCPTIRTCTNADANQYADLTDENDQNLSRRAMRRTAPVDTSVRHAHEDLAPRCACPAV